jgi:hypothetical protein
MKKLEVVYCDDVEAYFDDLGLYISRLTSLSFALRYLQRIREEVEVLSYLAPMLPESKYELPKQYHPEAKTYVVGNKKLTVIFHIDEDYVIVDKILPSALITY